MRKVVVGYDGSTSSEAAIADIRRAALPSELECVVLSVSQAWITREEETSEHVLEHAHEGERPQVRDRPAPEHVETAELSHGVQALHEARAVAELAAERIRGWFPQWSVVAEVRPDAPVWGLLDKVREWNADLVVVGTHERSAMGRLIHGSVVQSLMVDAPCSVRIARTPWTSEPAALRVVAALDGCRDADAAVGELAARRWPAGSAIHLVSAYSPVFMPGAAYFGMNVDSGDFDDEDLAEVFGQIERARKRLEPTGVTITQSVRLDDPVSLIIDEASRWGADAIFLGARGHRAVERILLGSVSAAVARRAHCSVEIVRPWKHVEL
jgi:nucleotide-binding universal stress UspA family protein